MDRRTLEKRQITKERIRKIEKGGNPIKEVYSEKDKTSLKLLDSFKLQFRSYEYNS